MSIASTAARAPATPSTTPGRPSNDSSGSVTAWSVSAGRPADSRTDYGAKGSLIAPTRQEVPVSEALSNLLHEERRFKPTPKFAAAENVKDEA